MKVTLPYPPSANRYWRHGRGRTYVSEEAQEYRQAAKLRALTAGMRPLDGPVVLHVTVFRPQKRGDLSNRIKVLEDALIGVAYADDDQVAEIHALRLEDKANPRVEVRVEPQLGARQPSPADFEPHPRPRPTAHLPGPAGESTGDRLRRLARPASYPRGRR